MKYCYFHLKQKPEIAILVEFYQIRSETSPLTNVTIGKSAFKQQDLYFFFTLEILKTH